MKILCIQLARLGDILQSAPTLHALKRVHPSADVDILVRPRFREAAELFSDWINIRTFDTGKILGPLLLNQSARESLIHLEKELKVLSESNYDLILNFSFSRLSSLLTRLIGAQQSVGYSVYDDLELSVQDFTSGYFFSQVGVGRPNRLHITDLFANMAGLSLDLSDWSLLNSRPSTQRAGIVLHVGASQSSKSLKPQQMKELCRSLLEVGDGPITLVGAIQEKPVAQMIFDEFPNSNLVNLCGVTHLNQLVQIIQKSSLVIGADSAPMHLASLSGIPCLNISCSMVNFFETGPRSAGSRVIYSEKIETVRGRDIAEEAQLMLTGRPRCHALCESRSPLKHYDYNTCGRSYNEWGAIQTAYFRMPFRGRLSETERRALLQLREINQLMIEEIFLFQRGDTLRGKSLSSLNLAEDLLSELAKRVPLVAVLQRWLCASRATVGPKSRNKTFASFLKIHSGLNDIIREIIPGTELNYGEQNI